MNELLEAGLRYASWGWRVFPLHNPTGDKERPCSCGSSKCESVGKHPRIIGWQQNATTDPDKLSEWWRIWPASNVGIAMGEGSGIWALDIDGSEGLRTLAAREAKHEMLPVTAESITGSGGRHKLFAYSPGLGNRVRFAPGLDVRTEGGLIVAPPSLHESGCYYMWDPMADPSEVGMAEAPEWLLAEIRAASRPKVPAGEVGAPIQEGGRNDRLFRDGCSMRRRGFREAAILAALKEMNQAQCVPPLDEKEVRIIAGKAAKYAPEPEAAPTNGVHPPEAPLVIPAAEAEEWEKPIPLYHVSLPEFPVDALPSYLRAMVEATATATQTPPDLAAMVSLAVIATASQKRAEAVIREGWQEVLSLWTVTALPPGNRKTPAYAPMVQPVQWYEQLLVERMKDEIAEAKTEYEITEGALKKLKDQAIKAKNQFDREEITREAVRLAQRLERMPLPRSPRMIADDATPEELGRLLASNAGRMAIISDEGDVFDMMAGKYSSGKANIGIYLRGHSAGDVIVDRIGRPDIIVRRAAITFGLCVQPESLSGLTTNQTFKGRGLLGRFLYSVPYSRLGYREIRPTPLSLRVSGEYGEKVAMLLAMPADVDEDGSPSPHLVPFSSEADDAVAEFEGWIEPNLRPNADMGDMGDWAGKLAGQTCRIATLLHLARFAGQVAEPWKQIVEAETFHSARRIAEYLIPHARAAFRQMGADPAINKAQQILHWLKEKKPYAFTKRDAYNALRGTFERAKELDEPLAVLMEHGFIRQVTNERKPGPGQNPSPLFRVHPSVFDGVSAYSA